MNHDLKPVPHKPVLYKEIINAIRPISEGVYIDGTVGAGGHAFGILEASAPHGKLLGFDKDLGAIQLAAERLKPYEGRFHLIHGSYLEMEHQIRQLGWGAVNGICLDLGVSSMQLDDLERGFSFQHEAPLDMRFDQTNLKEETAADLVNGLDEADLANILFEYGEEHASRRIAAAIIRARPITTTTALASVVASAVREKRKVHPATKTFQALRIATNQELDAVKKVLPIAIKALGSGGRLAVIAFHSLEDRMVKQYFRLQSTDCICPPKQLICNCDHKASVIAITRKPIVASEDELNDNPRARSARLRVVEKK